MGTLALPALAAKKQAPPRPSLLLIVVDRLPAWMTGPYGNKEVRTPTLDHLAQTGTRFLNHFVDAPDPSTSLATLLTGRTPMQMGGNSEGPASDVAIEKAMAGAGYACHATAAGAAPDVTADANRFLDQQAPGKNFCLTVRYSDLHAPYDGVPQKYLEQYASQKFEDYAAGRPAENARAGREMLANVTANLRKVAAAITAIDDQVGAVIAKLRQKQLADGTMIVFTSTCGSLLGRHGLWASGDASDPVNMYDEVINTPLIWSWPTRIPPQGLVVELVSNYDFVPTLSDFIAVESPAHNLCGRSYLLLATGKKLPKKTSWRTTVCGHLQNTDMAREERYKVVLRDGGKGPNELYDLPADRQERVNQYANPEYLDVKTRLTAEIGRWKQKFSQ